MIEKIEAKKEEALEQEITLACLKSELEIEALPDSERIRSLRLLERGRCWGSFRHFLKYVKIIEPPTQVNPGGVIKFELWEHIKKFIVTLQTNQLISLLKSRQVGASWTIAAWVLWNVLSKVGSTWMLFSRGENEAIELLGKCRRIYSQLPDFLQNKLNPDSATEMGFPRMRSVIKAFAATETAGISFTASGVVDDEHSEHPYADQNYLSSKPTRDAGGQFISIFTANKLNPDNLATAIFKDALDGKNDFIPLFFDYSVRPGRDRDWYAQTKRNIPERELAKLSPELYMEQNYPASIDEALRPTQTVSAFDIKVIDEMMGETRNPIKIEREGIDPKIVHIYQDFHIGEFYIAATDCSHGIGKDFGVTTVMNVKKGAVVADIMSNILSPEELALHSVRLLKEYHNPLWFPEDNEWGRVVITTAQNLGYKNFGKIKTKTTEKIGWHTDEKTRFDLWGGLIPAINNHQITIYNQQGLKQFYDIIRNASQNGRIEAAGGKHDDYPMAVGICWCKKDEVHTTAWDSTPIESLHFRRR